MTMLKERWQDQRTERHDGAEVCKKRDVGRCELKRSRRNSQTAKFDTKMTEEFQMMIIQGNGKRGKGREQET